MKYILTSLLCLYTSFCIACPDLTGDYQCSKKSEIGAEPFTQSIQKVEKDGTIYYTASVGLLDNLDDLVPTDGQNVFGNSEEFYFGITCTPGGFIESLIKIKKNKATLVKKTTVKATEKGLIGLFREYHIVNETNLPGNSYIVECERI